MPSPDPIPDSHLGNYHLLRILGHGGMGTVYLAHDDSLDRPAALKILHPPDDQKPAALLAKRFLREAKSAARINHPNVVTIYTVDTHADRPYLAMEYVEGGSLAEHVRRQGPMDWRDSSRAIRDALAGLSAAHARGVVHRDIKPANLMHGRDLHGQITTKVVDFGLARVLAAPTDGELTHPGAFVGSPSYGSPEQITATSEIDGRSDLYSLAATWYALLTGQPPFIADDPEEIMERHLHEEFPDVRDLAPAVPSAVMEILRRASQKNPEKRYPNASEMLAAVENLLHLPDDVPADVRIKRTRRITPQLSRSAPLAEKSVSDLESRLALARRRSDSSTQLASLRSLFGLYSQLDRREDALRAYREALVIHIKLNAPGQEGSKWP